MKRIKLEKVIQGDLVFYIDTVNSEIPRITLKDRRLRYSSLVIPSEITHDGKTYKIDPCDCVFDEVGRHKIEELILSEGIETVGLSFFKGNDYLVTLILPKSLKKIGDYSFYNCKKLKNVKYFNTQELGYYALSKTPFLKDYIAAKRSLVVYLGKSIIHIDRYVENLKVEEGTKYICCETNPCKYISNLYLPKSIVRADLYIQKFLKSIYFEEVDSFLNFLVKSDIRIDKFFNSSIDLYLKDKKLDTLEINNKNSILLRKLPIPFNIENYILNSDIKNIELDYFYYQENVTELYFPETIKTIWGSLSPKYNGKLYDRVSISIGNITGYGDLNTLSLRDGTNNIEIAYNYEYYSQFLSARFISSSSYEPKLNIKIYLVDQRKDNRERFFKNITTICNRIDTRVIFSSLEVDSWALEGFDEYFDKNFKKSSTNYKLHLYPIIDKLFVPGNLVKEFNKSYWSFIVNSISPIEYKNRFSIRILDSGNECMITNYFKDAKNSYTELIYIPQYIQYEGGMYKVVGIDNIAFTESSTRDCIVPGDEDFNIEPYAFFDCHPDLKVRKVLVD